MSHGETHGESKEERWWVKHLDLSRFPRFHRLEFTFSGLHFLVPGVDAAASQSCIDSAHRNLDGQRNYVLIQPEFILWRRWRGRPV